ncbi:flavonol synthase [Alicyclobacillus cellulosilyticus]|uniref:Flavonol synthase n=1 Tax=Alicyclobacillus cellulosilyticus TaxID=1003997 RepID=A0A917NN84_9BACL|nr:isopenicillin N synthase family oxygenase [Alicyclobacillus cellulosilyticus]GGJ13291.1 flavonol synthase [Alicyclobacillus cellulosilyticus]
MDGLIRVLDLEKYVFGQTKERIEFAGDLVSGLQQTGFVILEGHGIERELILRNYSAWKKVFSLNTSVKEKYGGVVGGQRGYTGFGKEHAKGRSMADLKEFWQIGHEFETGHPMELEYPRNVWPQEVPELRSCCLTLFHSLERVAFLLLEAFALHFDLRLDFFHDMIRDGSTILRAIHYPPVPQDTLGIVRAAEHADISLMTLLVEATDTGLEILTRDGHWIPIHTAPGQIVVNTGLMMARLTNDFIPATVHRVLNHHSNTSSRYALPFFVQPRHDVILRTVPLFMRDGTVKYPPITVRRFLEHELSHIGLLKSTK